MGFQCRTCDGERHLKNIFGKDVSIAHKLMSVANVQVNQNDLLSQKICTVCLTNLEACYNFKLQCEEFDKRYRAKIELETKAVIDCIAVKQELVDVNIVPYVQDIKPELDLKAIYEITEKPSNKRKKQSKDSARFTCTRCDITFAIFAEYMQHKRIHRKRYPCKICQKTFYSTAHLRLHDQVHKNVNELDLFKCDLCSKAYVSQTNLRRHKMSHKGLSPHLCKHCGKRFTTAYVLREHEKYHIEGTTKIIKCKHCDERFKSRPQMIKHLESTHNDFSLSKTVTCEVCGRSFINERTLKWHLKKHDSEGCDSNNTKPNNDLICDYCGKIFKYIGPYTIHLRTHTGEKPYECAICLMSFKCTSSLNAHSKIHSGEKPYTCELCDKKFFKPSNLKNHMKVHTGLKPYPCTYCNKSFSENCTLKIHIRTHTGERPFVCKICDMAYIDGKSLKKHVLKHNGNIINKTT